MSAGSDFKVTLLGTGTPIPVPGRFGPSTLIQAGGKTLLFDAGRGATIRLYQLGVPIGAVETVFVTHFHSDHTVGIPDVWLTGWLESHFGTRKKPLRVVGPRGAQVLMRSLEQAYAADIAIRVADEQLPETGIAVDVEEFDLDGVVYNEDGVCVIAFEVDHGDVIKPAYGYRIEYGGRAVVISGDTRPNENVVRYGKDADLLLHEVAIVRPALASEPYIQRILAHHTTAREAGVIFARTKPKLAAFTHLVFLASDTVPAASIDDLVAQTREAFDGSLIVGEDLMSFVIGDGVEVRRGTMLDLENARGT